MEDSTLNPRTDWIGNLGGEEGGRRRRRNEDKEGMHLCPSREEQVAFAAVRLEKGSPPGRRRTGSCRRRKPFIQRRPRSNHHREVGARHRRARVIVAFLFSSRRARRVESVPDRWRRCWISSPIGVYREWAGTIHVRAKRRFCLQ
jgi:hypothetical protein